MKDFLIATALTILAGISGSHTLSGQCVSGSGASQYQILYQDWTGVSTTPVDFPSIQAVDNAGRVRTVTLGYGSHMTVGISGMSGTVFLLDSSGMLYGGFGGQDGSVLTTGTLKVAQYSARTISNAVDLRYLAGHLYVMTSTGRLIVDPHRSTLEMQISDARLTGIAFDGQYLWISDSAAYLHKLKPGTGDAAPVFVSKIQLQTVTSIDSLLFDGRYLWYSSGKLLSGFDPNQESPVIPPLDLGIPITSMTFDGFYLWVGTNAGSVVKVNTGTFQVTNIPVPRTAYNGGMINGSAILVFDGRIVWIGSQGSNFLTKLRACDGANLGTVVLPGRVSSLVLDGYHTWITYKDISSISAR